MVRMVFKEGGWHGFKKLNICVYNCIYLLLCTDAQGVFCNAHVYLFCDLDESFYVSKNVYNNRS